MADVIITFRIMPEHRDFDLEELGNGVVDLIKKEGGVVSEAVNEPIAFGLSAIRVRFSWDENKGSTDDLEERLKQVKGVKNVEVIDVRRSIG